MKYHKTPKFLALQKKWYKKLEDKGFKDQEALIGKGKLVLKDNSTNIFTRFLKSSIERENREEYYRQLGQRVNSEMFDSAYDMTIMYCIAEGMKIIEISRQRKSAGLRNYSVDKIRSVIQKYEEKWKLRRH